MTATSARSSGNSDATGPAERPQRPLPYPRGVAPAPDTGADAGADTDPKGPGRRGFLTWAIAAPTLMVGTSLIASAAKPEPAAAVGLSIPEPADLFDLGDLQDLGALPTANLITISVDTNGIAHFAIPRTEVGQGITTSTSMIISEELDIPIKDIEVTLADARPELLLNQLTGGSNTTTSTFHAIRRASALARARLVAAAAKQWGVSASSLTTKDGFVIGKGRSASYGSLAAAAAASKTAVATPKLKPVKDFTVLGKPHNRVDALAAVTGKKQFTLDLDVPGALPTMIARPPTLNGKPDTLKNLAEVKAMPGVTDVAVISTGVAVRAKTFGQCIDAIRKVDASWKKGTEEGKSDADVFRQLKGAELPLAVPKVPLLAKTVEGSFKFNFRSNSPLETGSAIASYTKDGIEVWSCLKVPIVTQEDLATKYGVPLNRVKVHVTQGGGSFGRHLFDDAAKEAVEASKAFGKPVKLMWSRTDDFRQGRVHPACTSRVRATWLAGSVLTYEQRHTSVSTDFSHGLGEVLTALAARIPGGGNYSFAQSVFLLTQTVSYKYGLTTQLLNEVNEGFNTGSMRNIYSPDARTAQELITDELAKLEKKDPYQFRRAYIKHARGRAVLDKVAQVGNWGRTMPAGTAQGIAVHNEYKGWCACLVEIDTRTSQTGRDIEEAYTGPRVTKVVFAVDVGLPLNPTGLEAQMQGGIMDGIAQTLTSSLHLKDGYFLEGSWDNYYYTRQWNVPPEIEVIIMPATGDKPGGAGEFGVAAAMAATACAYGRAVGKMPTEFPINHADAPNHFAVIPTTPSTPQSPTDGLFTEISG